MLSFINNKNKIGYSANIKFTTYENIKREIRNGIDINDNSEFGKKIGTSGILMCNAGGITGGNTDNNLIFHIFGDFFLKNLTKDLKELQKNIRKTLNIFVKEKRKPQAFIFGGESCDKESKDSFVILKYLLEKFKIDHTVFWGTGESNLGDFFEKNIFYDV